VATPAPTANLPVDPDCFSNTTLLLETVLAQDTDTLQVYSLCRDTVFDIGTLEADGTITGGMAPLLVRSDTYYTCGPAPGALENNCKFQGGLVQVFSSPAVFGDEHATNARIHGVAFTGTGAQSGGVLAQGGDVTFQDCAFEVGFESARSSGFLFISSFILTHASSLFIFPLFRITKMLAQ
jgi:hypothetical protein